MLLYSLLHLFGYGLTTEDLASFRQWDSLTPTPRNFTYDWRGTTGPLGQDLLLRGMAMAEAHLAARFNTPEHKVGPQDLRAVATVT